MGYYFYYLIFLTWARPEKHTLSILKHLKFVNEMKLAAKSSYLVGPQTRL
jgi:hypothetical protein